MRAGVVDRAGDRARDYHLEHAAGPVLDDLLERTLDRAELLRLIPLSEDSPEARVYIAAARAKAVELAGPSGHISAQIGVDAYPCEGNCLYCGYAAVNSAVNAAATKDALSRELDTDTIVSYSRILGELGVQLISLMTTEDYPIDTLCALAEAVRAHIPSTVRLMANTGEIDLRQAQQLKASGFDMFYHAVRLGEGVITALDPEARRQSIACGKAAGLVLMGGTEPLYEGQSAELLADGILEAAGSRPYYSGLCALHAVEGTRMYHERPVSRARLQYLAALARLATGNETVLGFVGHTKWLNLGFDPRGRHNPVRYEDIQSSFNQTKQQLRADGWLV
ncbi:MAG: hypothetical protein LBL23_07735 [Coriobacteriales bacterium]|jgi:biotin synthase|nr:hypothetical protein [Coriobacteriales bacterium]